MITCSQCQKELPDGAEVCSACGVKVETAEQKSKAWHRRQTVGKVFLAVLFTAGAWVFLFEQPESDSTAASQSNGTRRINGADRFGCTDREFYDKLGTYASQQDTAAFSRVLTAGLAAEVCVKFTAGEEIFLADTAILSGLVKVRRPGQFDEYWTNMEAVMTR